MERQKLAAALAAEVAASGAEVAVYLRPLGEEPIYSHRGGAKVRSASVIKVPIMLAALELVGRGSLAMEELLFVPEGRILPGCIPFECGPREATVEELLRWMIIVSDNTATNVLLDRIGLAPVADLCATLGLRSTSLERWMRDMEAQAAGFDNWTSCEDMYRLYEGLLRGEVLAARPDLKQWAIDTLYATRGGGYFRRYIWEDLAIAHKTGQYIRSSHDVGVLSYKGMDWFLAVFVHEGAEEKGDPAFIGRAARLVFDGMKREAADGY